MISSLVSPQEGDVRLNNESILKTPQALRKVLGVVPQELAVYMDLSARENLLFFGKMHRIPKKILQKRVDEVLEIIGLKNGKRIWSKPFQAE